MREIKFRAWDNEVKQMIQWDEILRSLQFYFVPMLNENIILMQYTDLKDKNGKEIYEGDIVKEYLNPPRMNSIYEIKFNGGSFHLSNDSDKYVPLFAYDIEAINYLEVIGNIYENPELIPVVKG